MDPSLALRLERGELVAFPSVPFTLPPKDDLSLLFDLKLAALSKNISYNPSTKRVSGYVSQGPANQESLGRIFNTYSQNLVRWLSTALPAYSNSWEPDRATFRSEEEATRRL